MSAVCDVPQAASGKNTPRTPRAVTTVFNIPSTLPASGKNTPAASGKNTPRTPRSRAGSTCTSGKNTPRCNGRCTRRSKKLKTWAPSENDIPSRGSKNHFLGQCRPCFDFMSPGGCCAGALCNFCHFPHDPEELKELSLQIDKKADQRKASNESTSTDTSSHADGVHVKFGDVEEIEDDPTPEGPPGTFLPVGTPPKERRSSVSSVASVEKDKSSSCSSCGNIFLVDSIFCRKCGKKRSETEVEISDLPRWLDHQENIVPVSKEAELSQHDALRSSQNDAPDFSQEKLVRKDVRRKTAPAAICLPVICLKGFVDKEMSAGPLQPNGAALTVVDSEYITEVLKRSMPEQYED